LARLHIFKYMVIAVVVAHVAGVAQSSAGFSFCLPRLFQPLVVPGHEHFFFCRSGDKGGEENQALI
jgi:hypothetical protein